MEWIIESYDRRTDRDGESRFTTEAAFIRAGEDLLRNGGREFVSATLPDGTIVRDELALRALIAASSMGVEADRRPYRKPFTNHHRQTPGNAGGRGSLSPHTVIT